MDRFVMRFIGVGGIGINSPFGEPLFIVGNKSLYNKI